MTILAPSTFQLPAPAPAPTPMIRGARSLQTPFAPPIHDEVGVYYSGNGGQVQPSIRQRLSPFALQGGDEFNNPAIYQSLALVRTEEQDGIQSMADAKIVQYYALYCIYFATFAVPNVLTLDDPRFDDIAFPGWLISDSWGKTDVDPCEWHGIECDDNNRVTAIDLNENLLTGSFPKEVILLASDGEYSNGAGNLNRIDLYSNEFLFNDYDNSWMTHLGSNFEYLFFQATGFAGSLPRLPTSLIGFDCSYSLLTDGLTNENFQGLNNLTYLVLDGNAFNTTVPSVFGELESLSYFYIADNYIRGDLSFMEGGFPSIIELWIDYNPDLTGSIPAYIGDLTTLESLSISMNGLAGELPSEIGKLEDLKQFWINGNELVGDIPVEFGGLLKLKLLRLEDNLFSGSMPHQVCDNVGFLRPLETLGADCDLECHCCTCCGTDECSAA